MAWEFSPPPHKGEVHYDLGVWHPSTLTSDKQNGDGYRELQRRFERDCESVCTSGTTVSEIEPNEHAKAVEQFGDEICRWVDELPEEEPLDRPWSIALRCDPLFRLISLWPTVAVQLIPAILKSAQRHGLVCYDPQNGILTLPNKRL